LGSIINGQGWKSSGTTTKREAIAVAQKELQAIQNPAAGMMSFAEYSKNFFIPNKCPRARRLELEGKKPTDRYLHIQRMNIETHILASNFSKKRMDSIKRADILNLRDELNSKELKPATINKIITAVKTVFSEAFYREDILNNPSLGVANVKEPESTKDILTNEEIGILFNRENHVAIWKDLMAYTCFLLALNTGMRRGEILALRWKHIFFDEKYIVIEEAWKNVTTIGKPKSNKTRYTPISEKMIEVLKIYRKTKHSTADTDLVFSYCDGSRLGETWWRKKFNNALENGKIDTANRHLTPHSLRHTINTRLRDSNENPDKIRAILGWSSEAIQDRYTHWKPEHLQDLGETIKKVYDKLF